jgi:glycosyltransferase involved in cell wall biosynthesis
VLSLVALLREGFDVVHAHNPPDTFFPIGAWYKLLGKRFVFDHHDLAPEMYAHARFSDDGSKLVHRALIVLEQLTCRVADHIVTANDSHKALVMQRGNVPEHRITVVRNGPDIDSTRPTAPDPELRQRAGTILAYVGRIAPQDGLDYLVRAMHHLVYDLGYTDVLCVVMGDGDMMDELQALAQDLCVSDHIWFTGWISDKYLLRRYLATADICVDPDPANPYNDRSTMIKMMEYMAAGKPIVAFDLLESRRSADTAAVYVPNNDELEFARQIAALIDDPPRREAMGREGHARIQRELGWPHQGQRLLEAYAALEPA